MTNGIAKMCFSHFSTSRPTLTFKKLELIRDMTGNAIAYYT